MANSSEEVMGGDEETWYLLFTESHNAYDLVERSGIIAVGEVGVGEQVTFFHGNKPYVGKVTEKSRSYDQLNRVLRDLGTKARHVVEKKKNVEVTASHVLGRTRLQNLKLGPSAAGPSNAPPSGAKSKVKKPGLSEEEASRKRIREKNVASSVKNTNAALMKSLLLRKESDTTPNRDSIDHDDLAELPSLAKKGEFQKVAGIRVIEKDKGKAASGASTAAPGTSKPLNTQDPSEEEESRKRIRGKNMALAARNASAAAKQSFMSQHESDSDPDFNPFADSDDCDGVEEDFLNSVMKRKSERVTGVVDQSKGSPSKEFLKQQVRDLQRKLQFVYDEDSGMNEQELLDIDGSKQDDVSGHAAPPSHSEPFLEDSTDGKEGDSSPPAPKRKKGTSSDKSRKDTLLGMVEETPELDVQLRGDGEDMVHLHKGVFCRKADVRNALKYSTSVTHVVRRLIPGVFKPSELMQCTLSGLPYRADGNRDKGNVRPLHPKAIHVIAEYANEVASHKSWPQVKFRRLTHTISVKLNEIKKSVRMGKLKDED